MLQYNTLYIDGAWVPSHGASVINVESPSTEAIIGSIPEGNSSDVDQAVLAARAAFESWSSMATERRAEYLQKIHEGLNARKDEIARTISNEMGMPLKLAGLIQASLPIATFGMYAQKVREFSFSENIGHSLVSREAVGVVGCITPWNYPLHQIAAKVAAALAAGCTVILKPSEVAPLNAFILAEIIDAAQLPAGVFNLVTGYGPVVGEALVTHPEIDMLSFTGSTAAGKRIAALAASDVKRVALELGGKSASVLLEDADFPKAVKATINNCFLNSGQNCNAFSRMLVPEGRYAEVAALAREIAATFTVGDPLGDSAKLGPVVTANQREKIQEYVGAAIEEGAELLAGGDGQPEGLPTGYYVRPTIFGRVDPDSALAQDEIFGPVLAILTYQDEAEAVRIANNSRYGLAGGVWSQSESRAMEVARQLRAGQVDINGARFNPEAPFGGFKQSGYGRELGRFGMEEFLEYKSIQH
ncbi:aldehyde dehydrogenase family protein [Aestuariirhabdus litorea]|uniref:aldehyde dehydrogenase (NAD(+)) n=1 Tax=Aestuariirhabdus litorea TaxID=2528527 RepID=A0A3P3VMB6_9GAMM|nr:aldehyde dehydrogenase family protein [Aestuariirhabdus litorea]RRJ82806.1 aldehyde dehydrogenase family protein [Aestuariirhabdus litorea]RWW92965.1 aldehyde dehydrogenase family protein [Endozoicomonadaceae bacterium GTF-13]